MMEKLHPPLVSHQHDDSMRVSVFVLLLLDAVKIAGTLNKMQAMNASLMALKGVGVGVIVDAGGICIPLPSWELEDISNNPNQVCTDMKKSREHLFEM
ncbi:beta-amylase 3, chloroplastic-like [Senna tora]|uniref:Beta-amylase 3, chloroplastic-like n=1 Tax=Senna tora TaxID=362788 RepID=A0A834STD5_9FABA|nr:beta-amylase 3, chloroplastic-like [Senna tora]